jgi:hypothetical protein
MPGRAGNGGFPPNTEKNWFWQDRRLSIPIENPILISKNAPYSYHSIFAFSRILPLFRHHNAIIAYYI